MLTAGAMDIALGQGAAGVFTNSLTLWHCIFQVGRHLICSLLSFESETAECQH